MNISLKNSENAASAVLKLEVVKVDYANQVEKSLRNFRQKVNVPGFRKGMVPMWMVKKVYGKSVLIEEVNKIVSENLYKYVREQNLQLLGEPLPNQTEQQDIDFDTQEEFVFYFDIALAPEISFELNKRDKLTYYQIVVDDGILEKQIDLYRANYGTYDEMAEVMEERDLVQGVVVELENGIPKEGGIVVKEAMIMPLYVKNEEEKAKFIGAKKDVSIVFNPGKAYEGADAEMASFLKINKEDVAGVTNDFSFEIKKIIHYKSAELNQELFDKVFGEGIVTTEDSFKDKVKESISEQFIPQINYKLLIDARKLFLKKAGDITLADALLKRWLLETGEKMTKELVEADYPKFVEDLTYHLAKESMIKRYDIKAEDEDIEQQAKKVAKIQFAQYSMLSQPEDMLNDYAKDILKNKETLQSIIDQVIDDKLVAWLKEKVKLEIKDVTIDEFNKLFEGEK